MITKNENDQNYEMVEKELMNDLLTKCEEEMQKEMHKTKRRGKDRREKHSIIKKANAIDEVEMAELSHEDIATKYNINRSLIRENY